VAIEALDPRQWRVIGRAMPGLHLMTGDNAKAKFENQIRNLNENRFVVVHAVLIS